ncbi:unnamed protein product [Rhizoctonia solani]|uniref:Uncharacterized protein n=1 Tax=Rhizoctonia solani TaxID=456999 RepID=A0A8H2XA27_9AGAM|nr:unnamed protein product [Rhizoctonia solani]
MLSELLDGICLEKVPLERLSTLAHAADCLASAASALSEAARAVAESFTSEPELYANNDFMNDTSLTKDLRFGTFKPPTSPLQNPILSNTVPDSAVLTANPRLDHTEENTSENGLIERDLGGRTAGNEKDESDVEASTAKTAAEAIDNFQEPLDIGDANPHEPIPIEVRADPRLDDSGALTEIDQLIDPKQSYRILVESDLEVLLSVCALIGQDQRVICYMPCGIPPLTFYKQLIEGVTGTSVFFSEGISAARRNAAYTESLKNDNSVVLIPDQLSTNVVMEGGNTWVIHVGWPPNLEKYTAEVDNHQARHNVIVASAGNLDLYPSCIPLMDQTQNWPERVDSIADLRNILRQTFEQKLATIADEVKQRVYEDWIQSHGVNGSRYVRSWDSIMLVQNANDYLLHRLKYRHRELELGIPEEILLPEVSQEYVDRNLLESAVQAKVLYLRSEARNHYEGGFPAAAEPRPTNDPEPAVSGFCIDVNWSVGPDVWVTTSPEVSQKTGITRYKLLDQPSSRFYQYTLWFTNNTPNNYVFHDKSGDAYSTSTWFPRNHYVQYNSAHPAIIRITGW